MFRFRIRVLREKAGYRSQQSFANDFGVAQTTVAGWESGKREPKFDTLIKLANFFDVSVDYLLGYKGHSKMSDRFKCSLREALEWLAYHGDLTEPEAKADYAEAESIADSPFVLSIDEIYRASELVGESIDDMLSEKFEPRARKGIKKSPDGGEPTSGDLMNGEIIALMKKMSDEQKVFLLSLLQTTVERNQGMLSSVPVSASGENAVSDSQSQT